MANSVLFLLLSSLLANFLGSHGSEDPDIVMKKVNQIISFRHRRSWSSAPEDGCFASIKMPPGFLGYHGLNKTNVKVKFIQFNETHRIARVKWIIPQEVNAPSILATTIHVGKIGATTSHSCTLLHNKTSIDIRPFAGWNFLKPLVLLVMPQPLRENASPPILTFVPKYEEVSTESPIEVSTETTTRETRDNTKVIVGGVSGGALGIVLIVLLLIYQLRNPPPPRPPREDFYYVSYFPESRPFVKKVENFVCWSRENGFDVQMDSMLSEVNQSRLKEMGPFRFGEVVLRKARNVFLVVSPSYLRLCRMDEQSTGKTNIEVLSQDEKTLYYEIIHFRTELYQTMFRNDRFIPILFDVREMELPFWMKELVLYSWPEDAERLLVRLYNLPECATENINNGQPQEIFDEV